VNTPDSTTQIDVSLVIPVYNESASIPLLLDELEPVMLGLNKPFEVIMVDDGSADGTAELLKDLGANRLWLHPLILPENRGQSAALYAGFLASRGAAIVVMDGDMEHDPKNIPSLLAKLWEGYDLVCGRRMKRNDAWIRRVGSRVGNAVRNAVLHDGIQDATWKVFRREFVDYLLPFNGMHRFFPPIFRRLGARIAEAPVTHRARQHGQSHYKTWDRLRRGIADLFGVAWYLRRSFPRDVCQAGRDAKSSSEDS